MFIDLLLTPILKKYHQKDEKNNFENLVYQLFEFILVLKENKKYKAIIKKAIDELCFYTVTYMQMTDEQV